MFPVTTNAPRLFQNRLAHSWFGKPQTMPLKTDPGDDAGRKKAVRAWLEGLVVHQHEPPIYTNKHPFPLYIRGGYASMDEFMEGFDWQFSYDSKAKQLNYEPIRDEYVVVRPITDRTGVLMLNFYIPGKPPKSLAKKIPIEMLRIDNPFFFTTY